MCSRRRTSSRPQHTAMSWFLLTQSTVPLGPPRDNSTDSAARDIEAMFCRLLGEEWETDLANRYASSPMSDAELDTLFQELTNPAGPENPLSPVGFIPGGAVTNAPPGPLDTQGQYQAWLGQWVGYVAEDGTVGLNNIRDVIFNMCDKDLRGKHGKRNACRMDCGSRYHACHSVFWVCTNRLFTHSHIFVLIDVIGSLPTQLTYTSPPRWTWHARPRPAEVSPLTWGRAYMQQPFDVQACALVYGGHEPACGFHA
jgi:hypothetical protein